MKVVKSIVKFISNNSIWLLIIVYVYVRSFYWNCPPVWDGMAYFSGLLNATRATFDILNYCVDGHLTQAFLLIMGLPFKLFKQDFYLFNVWLTLFGIISLVAFYNLASFFFKNYLSKIELVLVTTLFAFHPSVLSSMINFNIDIGVLTFFMLYWLYLLRRKRMIATAFAFLLAFSKETSMLLIILPFLFCLLFETSSVSTPWLSELSKYFYSSSKEKVKVLVPLPVVFHLLVKQFSERIIWIKKHIVILIVPYFSLVIFISYKVFIRHQPAFWTNLSDSNMTTILNYFSGDGRMINYLGLIFVINFNWILSIILIALIALSIIYRKTIKNKNQLKPAVLLLLLFIFLVFILTLVRSWSDVRYLTIIIPITILCIIQILSLFSFPRLARLSVIVLLLILFSWENIRTVDPLSKALFGTFNFGNHEMLYISKRTNETPGSYGRDELVYKLEFLKIRQLLNKIFEDIQPNSQTCFISNGDASWMTLTTMDDNYKMAIVGEHLFSPLFLLKEDILKPNRLPADVYLLDYPNSDNTDESTLLNGQYSKSEVKVYDIDGYQMKVVHYKK